MPFVHLHTHSHYSLLQGLSKIDGLVGRAKKERMSALALTDHGNLYGAISFHKAAKSAGIKPIIGMCAYLAESSRFDKQPNPENRTFHLTLLARNEEGYRNLVKLATAGHLEGFYYRPRIDKELLRAHAAGLIALSGDMQGEIARALWNNDKEKAHLLVEEYKNVFGEEYFYIEIMHHPAIERHDEIMGELVEIARSTDTPLVATQGSYYLDQEDKEAHRTLLAVQTSQHMGEEARYFSYEEDFSFITASQAAKLFAHVPDAIENTVKIAEACNFEIESPGWIFPEIEVPAGTTHDEELRRYAYEGIKDRGLPESKEVIDRLEYELGVITGKGFAPYFLVVADLLYHARKRKILTTIRGSVAGSLVTYLTKITNVNPLDYGIPFERFLNPERPSAPDIDMDFADDRRDEMIEYAKEKYGEDKVAQIGTFGTMLARGVVRDVARALGYPYAAGDRIAKLIPFGSQGFPMTIERAMELEPELVKSYEADGETREIIDLARKLEGSARHCGVHAAGVVISPVPLTDLIPLQREPKGEKIITQYDMHAVEEVGLLKFDFLGLKNLSILERAVRLVERINNVKVDIENIPLDDEKTFAMLSRGETYGLFQLGGDAMTAYLKELEPTSINDINAMIALYRPGPMQNIPHYIARKHGREPITYYHPKMKEFLQSSYGILVYQEDIMLTALALAGYTWKTVDKLRKAIGKKIPAEMAKQHEIFVKGCIEHSGMSRNEAEKIWQLFLPFQGYGFNKAHAACYGRVAYQTAYMKANFPSEYMTALLTSEAGDVEEVARVVSECKRMGIDVLPPDVNESFGDFTAIKHESDPQADKIRFGLYSIKNLGNEIAHAIIEERKMRGPYRNFPDFLDRVHHQNLNKRSLEALAKSGAMDSITDRSEILANVDEALTYNRDNFKQKENQPSIFGLMTDTSTIPTLRLKKTEPASREDLLAWEKEHLGLYVSGHPLEKYKDRFAGKKTIKDYRTYPAGREAVCGGIIEDVRAVTTRRGERMAFVKLADFDESIEVVFFPKNFETSKQYLLPDACVAIQGRISIRNDTPSIVAEKIKPL